MANLQLIGYVVKKIDFEVNDLVKTNKVYNIHPNVRFDVSLKGDLLRLSITLTIKKTEDNDLPFNVETLMVGDFKIKMASNIQDLTKEACVALYPYLRAMVSNLTTTANISPYYLPFLDFDKIANSINNPSDQIKLRAIDEEI